MKIIIYRKTLLIAKMVYGLLCLKYLSIIQILIGNLGVNGSVESLEDCWKIGVD